MTPQAAVALPQITKRRIVGSPKAWGSVVLISQCQAPPGRLISDMDPISDGPMPDPHRRLALPSISIARTTPCATVNLARAWIPIAMPQIDITTL